MTRVVFAVDSFKGTVPATEAAHLIADGWREADDRLDAVMRPMADGGEGTLDAFAAAHAELALHRMTAPGADGATHEVAWGMLPDRTAVVELANVCGIEGMGERRLPFDAHSTGLGIAIAAALDAGAERMVVGIGSSASTDGGAGMLVGLGARILDASGRPVSPGARGLPAAATIDLAGLRPLPRGGVRVLTDVTNPLLGERGAAVVFGPQKGADDGDVLLLDQALAHWAERLVEVLPHANPSGPGAGAAGGVGFALQAWGAELVPGSAAVADLIGLEAAIAGADVVVTGEGSYDRQSADGKVPALVAALAAKHGVPASLVAGRIAPDADTAAFALTASLTDAAGSAQQALADPRRWLRAAGRALAIARPANAGNTVRGDA